MAGLPAEGVPDHAFERLYRRHVGDVYRYAVAVLANQADAEDVTQTTFMNAYRAFERGQRPERPLNWLITIAHNVCRQRFRQQSRRPSEVALDYDVADELVDDDQGVRAEDIRRALSQLAFNQRAALVMRELEGRSYLEIGETLGLSVAAVETLLFRARRALREQLEGGLTCGEAERGVSRQLDGMLDRRERGALRAHLRACPDCAALARRMRAQRSSLKGLAGALPLPASLASFSAGGGVVAGAGATAGAGGLLLKIAAVTAAGLAAGGAGYETVAHRPWAPSGHARAASALAAATRPRPAHAVSPTHPTPAPHSNIARSRAAARSVKQAQPGRSNAGLAGTKARATSAPHTSRSARAPAAKTTGKTAAAPLQPSRADRARRQAVNTCTQARRTDPVAFATAYNRGQRNGADALSRCVLAQRSP